MEKTRKHVLLGLGITGLLGLLPTLAIAAPPAAQESEPAGRQLPPWLEDFWASISGDAMDVGLRALLAVLLFVGGWLVAKFVSYLVYRVLERTEWDNKLAATLHIDTLFEKGKKDDENALERTISSIVYYLLMALVVVGVLEFAGLSQAAGPIQTLVDTVAAALPLVGKAVLILLASWAAATILSRLVTRALDALNVDERFARMSAPDEKAKPEHAFSTGAGRVVFWLIMVIGLAGAFDALKIAPLSEPLRNALDELVGILPGVGFAALIAIGGWVVGKLARAVVSNVLEAVGFDRLVARVKLDGLFGETKPSQVGGWVAMAFVYLQTAIAALDQVGLQTLSEPLTDMMAQFWAILPVLTISVLIVVLGVFVGRLVRAIVTKTLQSVGFDKLMDKLGFGKVAQREDKLGVPSEVVGFVVMAGIILVSIAQSLDNLGLDTWAGYVDSVISFTISHVVVALVIVGVGFAIGNYVRDLINARQEGDKDSGPQWLGDFVRYAVLVFAFTMAVHQLGVAEDFVLLSFGMLFGGLCLAMALAFGLGSRDVAGEIVKRRWDRVRSRSAKPSGGVVPPVRPPGA